MVHLGCKDGSSGILAFAAGKSSITLLLTLLIIANIDSVAAFELNITAPLLNSNISGTFLLTATTSNENVTNLTFWFHNGSYFNITRAAPNVTLNNVTPQQTNWNFSFNTAGNMSDGVYTFGVLAFNATGESNGTDYTINATNVVVDNNPPRVTSAQTNLTVVVKSNVVGNFSANVTDAGAGVANVTIGNNTNVSMVSQGGNLWAVNKTASDLGCATTSVCVLRIYANDTLGNMNATVTLSISVDETPPSITISAPSRVQRLASANLTITIYDLQPGFKKIFRNGSLEAGPANYSDVNNIPFNFSINTSATGDWNYTVWANDSVGNANEKSVLVEVTAFEADSPVITITNPVNESTINILNNTVTGSIADESDLKNVTLYLNGAAKFSWTSKGSFNKIVDYTSGANTIKITAEDVHGNNASSEITVNVAQPSANVTVNATANQTTVVNETIANTSTYIEFLPTANGTVNITVEVSTNASQLNATDPTQYVAAQNYISIEKFTKINVSGAVNESANLSWVLIRVYYSDADLDRNGDGDADDPGDINPTSLKLWRYCPADGKWDVVDKGKGQITCGNDTIRIYDSGVNTTGKFVFANLSSFSVYGLAGTITPAAVAPAPTGAYRPIVVVVANSIDRALAADFYGFLRNQGLEVVELNATNFLAPSFLASNYKNYRHVIILGGPDAPEGIGEIVRGILSEDEQKFLRTRGNRKMYVKTGVWATGQVVRIIVGSGRTQTQEEVQANREDVGRRIKYNLD